MQSSTTSLIVNYLALSVASNPFAYRKGKTNIYGICWYKCITQICIARTSHTQTDMYHAHTLSYNIYSFLHSSESRSQHISLSTVNSIQSSLEPSQSVLQVYWNTLVLLRIRAHVQHYFTTYTIWCNSLLSAYL